MAQVDQPTQPEHPAKTYLGDSVYVDVNGWGGIILTTENGLPNDPSNTIVLEGEVWIALSQWVNARKEK